LVNFFREINFHENWPRKTTYDIDEKREKPTLFLDV